MGRLYENLLFTLQEHWKQHQNAYPLRFEITSEDLQALNAQRKLVNTSMNFKQPASWESEFHGVPLVVALSTTVVTVTGEHMPLRMPS